MRVRIVHTLLALLILVQSVSTLAIVSSVFIPSVASLELLADDALGSPTVIAHQGEMTHCHGDSAVGNPAAVKDCCESMEDSGCILSCASIAAAVPCSPALDSMDAHIRYRVDAGYAAPHKSFNVLFRPPRTS
jgi:hypothetical protein